NSVPARFLNPELLDERGVLRDGGVVLLEPAEGVGAAEMHARVFRHSQLDGLLECGDGVAELLLLAQLLALRVAVARFLREFRRLLCHHYPCEDYDAEKRDTEDTSGKHGKDLRRTECCVGPRTRRTLIVADKALIRANPSHPCCPRVVIHKDAIAEPNQL